MQYRTLGKTGLSISPLGFGAMRLPFENPELSVEIIHKAFSLGVNYIDTALYYGIDNNSEEIVGKALKGWRERVYVSTKNPIEDTSGANFRKRLETSLKKLDVDYIDIYYMWGINWKAYEEEIDQPNGPLQEALKLKSEGLIKHLGFSFHGAPGDLIKLVDTGNFETILCQYNLLDRSNEAGIAHAFNKGIGVSVMGPVGGGKLGYPTPVIRNLLPGKINSSPEIALRFVLTNPHVHVALSGMSDIQQVEENVVTASRTDKLSETEVKQINASLEESRKLADLYCTGCKYCMPCPNEVNIPENFTYMNYYRVYKLEEYAKSEYSTLGTPEKPWAPGKKAADCIECGQCEPKCPQKIPIMAQLKEVAAILGK